MKLLQWVWGPAAIIMLRLKFGDGERVCPDHTGMLLEGHLDTYRFMAQFVLEAEVLDVGCGYGYGSHHLLQAGAQKVCGIDFSRSALRYACRRYVDPRLTFRSMNAESLDFPDAAFDVVTSAENIEHLSHPERCMTEIRRVLRPDGLLLLATPNKEISSPGMKRPKNRHHKQEYDFDALKALLRRHFDQAAVFETDFTGSEETQRLRSERRRRQSIGIEAYGESQVQVGPYRVDLTHRKNSHSFLAMAWNAPS